MDESVSQLIDLALAEDIGPGDVTSEYFIPADREAAGFVVAREPGVLAGAAVAAEVFRRVDPSVEIKRLLDDGMHMATGAHVLRLKGKARSILTAERVALNFLQRMSGVATKTARFVAKVEGTSAHILDTRKTTPGWRALEKAAVVAGGGVNHRMGLYDRAIVKDNHLVAEGGVAELQAAINRLRKDKPEVEIELEVDTLEQLKAFLQLEGVDYIMLDNMENEMMARAVEMRGEEGPRLEASGGVNLATVHGIAETGVDFISVGAITHSAVALDLALDFEIS